MKNIILILAFALLPALAFCQDKPAKKYKKRDTITIADKAERKLLTVKFSAIFKEEPNGDFTALYPVKINFYTIEKGGSFPGGGSIGGVTFDSIKGRNLLIDTVKGVVIYKGVYH
jgi:hypothetical protein